MFASPILGSSFVLPFMVAIASAPRDERQIDTQLDHSRETKSRIIDKRTLCVEAAEYSVNSNLVTLGFIGPRCSPERISVAARAVNRVPKLRSNESFPQLNRSCILILSVCFKRLPLSPSAAVPLEVLLLLRPLSPPSLPALKEETTAPRRSPPAFCRCAAGATSEPAAHIQLSENLSG